MVGSSGFATREVANVWFLWRASSVPSSGNQCFLSVFFFTWSYWSMTNWKAPKLCRFMHQFLMSLLLFIGSCMFFCAHPCHVFFGTSMNSGNAERTILVEGGGVFVKLLLSGSFLLNLVQRFVWFLIPNWTLVLLLFIYVIFFVYEMVTKCESLPLPITSMQSILL